MFSSRSLIIFVVSMTSLASASVVCRIPGQTSQASWTDAEGNQCTYIGEVGSNFGINPVNGGDYSCNGRCGAGCTGTPPTWNAYTVDCYSHDICSWFYDSTGGPTDPNCKGAYYAAVDDTIFGWIDGCGTTNPSNPPVPPTDFPVCIAPGSGKREEGLALEERRMEAEAEAEVEVKEGPRERAWSG